MSCERFNIVLYLLYFVFIFGIAINIYKNKINLMIVLVSFVMQTSMNQISLASTAIVLLGIRYVLATTGLVSFTTVSIQFLFTSIPDTFI